MAISKTSTLLPLDTYAEFMAIPGWEFNQVTHPERPSRGDCDGIWLQSGYSGDPNRIVGRDDLARAIAVAERKIAEFSGFWPAPKWIKAEDHTWPMRRRGPSWPAKFYPIFRTNWGYLISAGLETWTDLELYPIPVVYTDEDGDGVLDTATVVFNVDPAITDPCELEIVPPGCDPAHREWRIRPLDVTIVGGVVTMIGPRWLFVTPDEWLRLDPILLTDDPAFLSNVTAYRHYNDTTSYQAQHFWQGNPCAGTPCAEECQHACVSVLRERLGQFSAWPAQYNEDEGVWKTQIWQRCDYPPGFVRIWYYAGYRDRAYVNCLRMSRSMQEAVVRLANVYLAEAPCGCGLTRERWTTDRMEMDMTTFDVALAQSAFGTTARGAVFARSVIASIPPLGQGG